MPQDPETMIGKLPDLAGEVRRFASVLSDECELIADEWAGLGRVGGQRADHAAALMGRLRPILDDLARFASGSSQRLSMMVADPFGRVYGTPAEAK
jgi:hypothetical protein